MIERPASSFVRPKPDREGQVAVIGDGPGAFGTMRSRKTEVERKALLRLSTVPIAVRIAQQQFEVVRGAAAFG